MKKSALAAFASLALLPVFPACDSHPWEDTKDGKKGSQHMFMPHGGHSDGAITVRIRAGTTIKSLRTQIISPRRTPPAQAFIIGRA